MPVMTWLICETESRACFANSVSVILLLLRYLISVILQV